MSNRAWAINSTRGVLGTGNTTSYSTPQLMATSPDFVEFATVFPGATISNAAYGRTADGLVYAWGGNPGGQLGNGSTDSSVHSTPAQVSGLSDIVLLRAGGHDVYALTSTGDLYAWGFNFYGQLGQGDTTARTSPTLIATGVVDVFEGGFQSVILKTGGVVQTAGLNGWGELGTGNTTQQTSWQTVTPGSGTVIKVRASVATTLMLFSDGSVKGWGRSEQGQLGLIQTTNTALTTISISNVVEIGCGGFQEYFKLSDATVWAVGHNTDGVLGVGQTFAALNRTTTPLQMIWPAGVSPVQFGQSVTNDTVVAAMIARGSDHKAYTWGTGTYWGMGNGGTTATNHTPVSSNGLVYARAVGGGQYSMYAEALDVAPTGRSFVSIVG